MDKTKSLVCQIFSELIFFVFEYCSAYLPLAIILLWRKLNTLVAPVSLPGNTYAALVLSYKPSIVRESIQLTNPNFISDTNGTPLIIVFPWFKG
jgi:hypothetical protein